MVEGVEAASLMACASLRADVEEGGVWQVAI